jgi:hypothetical protein
MIVNMYVDHLMSPSPASAEEVWNATRVHSKLFSDAAQRIGLTPSEYKEFRNNLLAGKAIYLTLPRRVDAMSGARGGSVYAVKNAVMTKPIMGWRVALADGNVVYVPQICGNISLLRHAAIAQAPLRLASSPSRPGHQVTLNKHKPARYVKADTIEPETPVVMTPDAPAAPATVAQAIPSAEESKGASPFAFLLPAALGGLLAGTVHGAPSTSTPVCSLGSNSDFACKK